MIMTILCTNISDRVGTSGGAHDEPTLGPASGRTSPLAAHYKKRKWFVSRDDIKVKREVLKLAQLMLGLFCCSKTISYQ